VTIVMVSIAGRVLRIGAALAPLLETPARPA
jgi:hypothetical protein